MKTRICAILVTLAFFWPVSRANAQQVFESTGSRALGMGGAFVAVANDATAAEWNPAGLAAAGPAGATIEWARFRTGDRDQPATVPGQAQRTSWFTGLGTWPVGLSYWRYDGLRLVEGPTASPVARELHVNTYAATLVQTILPGIVLGANLKYLRGSVSEADATGLSGAQAFDAAGNVQGQTTGAFDIDLGLMLDAHYVRLGVTAKNLRQPTFGQGAGSATSTPVELQRQLRAGLAVLPTSGLTLAMDMDLDTLQLPEGPRRMLAVGGEQRLGSRLAVRAGARWNLRGDRKPVGTVGASVMVRQYLWVDVNATRGNLADDRGYGAALRVAF